MKPEERIKDYDRVLPRDLFNESKLLKDLGFLVLYIQNGTAPEGLEYKFTVHKEVPPYNRQFIIVQDQSSGDLIVQNLDIRLYDEKLYLYHPYNEKESPSLRFQTSNIQGSVFDSEGEFSQDFIVLCELAKE